MDGLTASRHTLHEINKICSKEYDSDLENEIDHQNCNLLATITLKSLHISWASIKEPGFWSLNAKENGF